MVSVKGHLQAWLNFLGQLSLDSKNSCPNKTTEPLLRQLCILFSSSQHAPMCMAVLPERFQVSGSKPKGRWPKQSSSHSPKLNLILYVCNVCSSTQATRFSSRHQGEKLPRDRTIEFVLSYTVMREQKTACVHLIFVIFKL